MSVVSSLLKIFPKPLFFSEIKAIQIRNLYRDVITRVIEPMGSGFIDNCNLICARQNLTRIGVLYDLVYGNLHTGEWHAVSQEEREVFTIVCFLRVSF